MNIKTKSWTERHPYATLALITLGIMVAIYLRPETAATYVRSLWGKK